MPELNKVPMLKPKFFSHKDIAMHINSLVDVINDINAKVDELMKEKEAEKEAESARKELMDLEVQEVYVDPVPEKPKRGQKGK